MTTVYGSAFSPNVKRVLIALAEVGITAKQVTVDLAKGGQYEPDFIARNPNGKVPVLEWNGRHLWESPAILWELAKVHPDKKLLPTNDRDHAEMLRWMFWNASHLERPISIVVWERLLKTQITGEPGNEQQVTEQTQFAERFLKILNAHLKGRQWLAGNAFSIADITVGTTVDFGGLVDITTKPYQHIDAWFKQLTARPSWSVKWQGN